MLEFNTGITAGNPPVDTDQDEWDQIVLPDDPEEPELTNPLNPFLDPEDVNE